MHLVAATTTTPYSAARAACTDGADGGSEASSQADGADATSTTTMVL
jgi:hypothetical protein